MQLHCFKRCARVLCLVVIIARAVPCLDAQAYTLPERGSHGRDQPDRKLTVTDRSGDLLDLSFAFGSLNHTLQGCPYLPSVRRAPRTDVVAVGAVAVFATHCLLISLDRSVHLTGAWSRRLKGLLSCKQWLLDQHMQLHRKCICPR